MAGREKDEGEGVGQRRRRATGGHSDRQEDNDRDFYSNRNAKIQKIGWKRRTQIQANR